MAGKFERDPVSEWFDAASVRLITRAYENPGEWTPVYLAPPTREQRARMSAMGIYDPFARDRWGEARWVRAFKRSVFHLVNHYGGVAELREQPNTGAGTPGWHAPVRVQWETGKRVRKPGWPARRWAVRVRLHKPGYATQKAGRDAKRRWVGPGGHATQWASTAEDRDWQSQ